jgi:predicted nucleotidyltransferase
MTDRYSTKAARERTFISLLDEKLESIRLQFTDKQHVDEQGTKEGLRHRIVGWRLGGQEFHFTYTEEREAPGTAAFRIRTQPAKEGGIGNDWIDLQTLGDLDGALRAAKKARGPNPGDIRAQRNAGLHEGATPENLILVGLSGSMAYNLDHNGYTDPLDGKQIAPSDVDIRGLYVVPTKEILSLGRHKELVEQKSGADTVFDEIERFLDLCLNCNPERLEMLATSRQNGVIVTAATHAMRDETSSLRPSGTQRKSLASPLGELLVDQQDIFLSKRIIKTYGGYAKQQLYRIESKEERKTKPAMHLIRLMITGIRALRDGQINCDMSEYREQMMAIRTGLMPIEDVFKWHRELEIEFAKAGESTKLPDQPNREKANEILLEVRKMYLAW